MEILVLLALLVGLSVASLMGWTTDSRDFADWKPSDGGHRSRAFADRPLWCG